MIASLPSIDVLQGEIKKTAIRQHDVLETISDRGFFGRLDHEIVERLAASARLARYPAGAVLASSRQGTGPAVLVSGALRYFLSARDGRQLTLRYVGPGGLVGTVSRDASSIATSVEVLEPSVLLHFDQERLHALAAQNPQLSEALLDEVTERLRSAYHAIGARAFMSVRARVARDIVDRASLARPLRAGLDVSVTQQSLADAVGSVREVVGRALVELRREGAITSQRDRVIVLDPEALRRAARDVI